MTSGRFQLNEEEHTTESTATDSATSTSATTNTPSSFNAGSAAGNKNGAVEHTRKFVFTGILSEQADGVQEKLEIKIPELLQGGYSFYTWPCAPILAWFLWERRRDLVDKRILELGAGTALPGILAAKCGARVVLSDNCILPKSIAHTIRSCVMNNLEPGQDVEVIGLSWGLLLNSVFNLGKLDLIIAADCFYDTTVFEDIIVTVAFLLDRNPDAKFIFTYQERSADWSIEALLKKWKLYAVQINIDDLGKSSNLDILDLMGGHTIHLIQISKKT